MVCPQHVMQHHTRVKSICLTTFGLYSMVPSSTLNLLTNTFSTTLLPSGDPAVGYSFFPCELSSAVGFHHPWHQDKGVTTQKEIMQIWPPPPPPPPPSGSGGRSLKVPSSIFFLKSLLLKICASDEDPLDPTYDPEESVFCINQGSCEKKPL